MKFFKKLFFICTLFILMMGIVSCSNDSLDNKESDKEVVELGYVEWDTEIASTNVLKLVLEDEGYEVEITPLDNAIMWSGLANKEIDAMVSAWLPVTHKDQYNKYKDKIDDLGANLEGAKIGLVVPKYMDVNSIEDLSDEANKEITGIEAGAGVVATTEKALKEYDNLSDWKLTPSSSGAMVAALGQAYANEEDIVVTGWSPHWKFQTYDLKYLEDSKGIFGGEEEIKTMARKGLKDDKPELFNIIDNFHWGVDDIESVMLDISEGMSPEEAARKWIDNNKDKVDEWIK